MSQPALEPSTDETIQRSYYYDCRETFLTPPGSFAVSPTTSKFASSACVIAGNGNRALAEKVAALLGQHIHGTTVEQYASGEVRVQVHASVLGRDVYIIQPTTGNDLIDINTALMELLLLIRKVRLGKAARVTAVVPFFAYARQDRKTALRMPISASAVAEMITLMGVDRVVTLDLHSGQIQGFFENVPLDNLQFVHEFAQHVRSQQWFVPEKTVIVSPDAGGVERAKHLADILCVGRIVTIVKRRIKAGQVETMQTVGEVDGMYCIIIDDMCDTGGTLVKACELLKALGAITVTACCTHGILTNPCAEKVNSCDALSQLVVSDSIPQESHMVTIPKLVVLTIAPLLASAILKNANNESVSSLFTGPLVSKQKSPSGNQPTE
jgi:ribose-phosphate pyrophosphokinase